MTQKEKIMRFLKHHDFITQRDAYQLGIYRLGARIYELKDEGTPIKTEMVQVTNADGSKTYVARYSIYRGDQVE